MSGDSFSNDDSQTKDKVEGGNSQPEGSCSAAGEIQKRNDLRLWIGNLDAKLTELGRDIDASNLRFVFFSSYGYQLLKLIQRFGSIENFDFLFHRTGPHAGLPRGYAFVTYKSEDAALKCMSELNGQKILNKAVVVRWAQQANFDQTDEEEKLKKKLPALGIEADPKPPVSRERAISAIEAKLRAMEREKDQQNDFSLTLGECRKGSSIQFNNPAGRSAASSQPSASRRYQPYGSRPRFSRPPSRSGYRRY